MCRLKEAVNLEEKRGYIAEVMKPPPLQAQCDADYRYSPGACAQ
jgi:hypothetical protein